MRKNFSKLFTEDLPKLGYPDAGKDLSFCIKLLHAAVYLLNKENQGKKTLLSGMTIDCTEAPPQFDIVNFETFLSTEIAIEATPPPTSEEIAKAQKMIERKDIPERMRNEAANILIEAYRHGLLPPGDAGQ